MDMLSVYDENRAAADALRALEERGQLEKVVRAGIDVTRDAADSGPLYSYAVEQRAKAIENLLLLVDIDPNDKVSVATLQVSVREYLRVCRWVGGVIESADQAQQIIKERQDDGDRYDD